MSHIKEFIFSHIHPGKLSISFTWDDNFVRHTEYIAPIFEEHQRRCTFYVNPGEPDFIEKFQEGYTLLAHKGFEIGSHGYTHTHFSSLTHFDYLHQLIDSKEKIKLLLGIDPITFAFPHHDYTNQMLAQARKVYFETRNTLAETQRISLKSYTTSSDIQNAVENAISTYHSIVFSGHSIRLHSVNDISDGYEPVLADVLDQAISIIKRHHSVVEICTFSQAVLKKYIQANCTYTNSVVYITQEQLKYLEGFGLSLERIEELI